MSKKLLLYIVLFLALLFTVPWFFFGESETHILGFPTWAAYSIFASFLYACLITFCIRKFWNVSAHDEQEK